MYWGSNAVCDVSRAVEAATKRETVTVRTHGPAVYCAEVRGKKHTWIFSSPIYLRSREG